MYASHGQRALVLALNTPAVGELNRPNQGLITLMSCGTAAVLGTLEVVNVWTATPLRPRRLDQAVSHVINNTPSQPKHAMSCYASTGYV